ncbi:MAG TPA: glutamine-hydrolyzing carbamoyl-phosphate synthase small subunit [Burkholderiaceae bacterium]|nr:glutamine-hydrolyzing carbamoyl-phosphate synthase small subunit [Burkholderiaceae bacterium]
MFDDPRPLALLALADGSVFQGVSIGAPGSACGEVVFNTAMTGYQEILSDPSYCRQIVTLTYPHIGNVGANSEDDEAPTVFAAGLIVRDLSHFASNFRAERSLQHYLTDRAVVGIAGIDTRRLTRLLRDHGSQAGAIVTGSDERPALQLARSFPGMSGLDLAKVVSVREPYEWNETAWQLGRGYGSLTEARWRVVAYDFGIKRNILRLLAERGCHVTVVPAQTPASEVVRLQPDGVFLSNGPGDPEPCDYAIEATRELIERGYPTFGICLGHQIMGLAAGGRTLKMKFGHHGANHPVLDIDTGRVLITSQNHGFAVDPASLPARCQVTHRSLFDGSLQGFRYADRPAFCFQGHPEASPGPHDVSALFDRFVRLMQQRR